MDKIDMAQELGRADSDLVEWFGDMALYEPKLGISESQIKEAYARLINSSCVQLPLPTNQL